MDNIFYNSNGDKMKIKMFDEEDEKDLEKAVNDFLEETDKEKFIDVYQKFNINKSDYFKPPFFSELGIKENEIIKGVGQQVNRQSLKILKRKY